MASCVTCGCEARDGDWTCGSCGSPLNRSTTSAATGYDEPAHDQGYYQEPTVYGTTAPAVYGSGAPAVARPQPGRASGRALLSWLVLAGVVAVVAVAGLWFFVLRPAPGSQFLGTWSGTALTSSGTVGKTLAITRSGSLYDITLVSAGTSIGPFSATLQGNRLRTTYDYAGSDPKQRLLIAAVVNRNALAFNDFAVIYTVDHGQLVETTVGTPKSTAGARLSAAVRLTRAR